MGGPLLSESGDLLLEERQYGASLLGAMGEERQTRYESYLF